MNEDGYVKQSSDNFKCWWYQVKTVENYKKCCKTVWTFAVECYWA